MTPEQINSMLSYRQFFRYVVDDDEILIQHRGTSFDDGPYQPWVAILNRSHRFAELTRWETYEAARLWTGKVTLDRRSREVQNEIRRTQMDTWDGRHVPSEIDDLFGGLTMSDWSGPRTIAEWRAQRSTQ